MYWRVWLLFLLGAALANAAPRDEWRRSPKPIRDAVRATVEGQLSAIRADNFDRAYEFASAGIRARFSPAVFAAMIRRGYPALVRHTQAEVGAVRDDEAHRAHASVTVSDKLNRRTNFRYLLIEEEAGWRIDGVVAETVAPREGI